MVERSNIRSAVSRLRRVRYLLPVMALAVVAALVVPRLAASPSAADQPTGATGVAGIPVTVGTDACGTGWTGGDAGPETLALWNNSGQALEVYLEDASHNVYLDVENLGGGTTRSVTVTLGDGTYHFWCIPSDSGAFAGAGQQVTGSYSGPTTPGRQAVTEAELIPALKTYQSWVESRFPVLERQVKTLGADLRAGETAKAKRDWLTAHLTYETLGAAYDAFGDDNDAIDTIPSTVVPPVKDKSLAGFDKIEALLWHGRPDASIAPYAARIVRAIDKLRADFGVTLVVNPLDIGLRSHEILEDALEFELTGRDDAGSHTELATVSANIVGTRHSMAPIMPILEKVDPDLAKTKTWLGRLQKLVNSYDHHGSWEPLGKLTRAQREKLDATMSETVELLSEIAVDTDPMAPAR